MTTATGNAKHQAAQRAAAARSLELRVEIHQLLDTIARLDAQVADLLDSRQSIGPGFQSPASRQRADQQVRADRAAARGLVGRVTTLGQAWMNTTTVLGTGATAAPVTMPAASARAEILFTLQQHIRRLARPAVLVALEAEQTEIEDAGLCTWPRRDIVRHRPVSDGDVRRLTTDLARLVDGYTNRKGLHALIRDLEHLEETARTVLDGVPAKQQAPRPTCPWCGRDSLVLVHREHGHDVRIIRCDGDHPCTCTRRFCPCHQPRPRRHEWHQAAGAADTWPALARLQNDYEETTRMETQALDAIARIRQLHEPVPIHPWAEECPDQHEQHWTEASNADGLICLGCDPTYVECASCYDDEGNARLWPCPTVEAIDTPDPDSTEQEGTPR